MATSTRKKYTAAWIKFNQYLKEQNISLTRILEQQQLDNVMSTYILYLHKTQQSFDLARNTLSSIKRELTVTPPSLTQSKLSLQGWQRINASKKSNRPPITLEMCNVIATTLWKNGYIGAGIGVTLSFHCFLRIGELVSLTVNDILFVGDARVGSAISGRTLGTVKLARTKTGNNQHVTITDYQVARCVQSYITHLNAPHRTASLLNLTASQFRRLFKKAVFSLGLSTIGYTPHSLRHGAATRAYLCDVPLLHIMHRGRWRSTTALTMYVQAGAVFLHDTKIPKQLFEVATIIGEHVETVLSVLLSSTTTRMV